MQHWEASAQFANWENRNSCDCERMTSNAEYLLEPRLQSEINSNLPIFFSFRSLRSRLRLGVVLLGLKCPVGWDNSRNIVRTTALETSKQSMIVFSYPSNSIGSSSWMQYSSLTIDRSKTIFSSSTSLFFSIFVEKDTGKQKECGTVWNQTPPKSCCTKEVMSKGERERCQSGHWLGARAEADILVVGRISGN